MKTFDGQIAVVTGGASGIGAGTARRLSARGAHVVVADRDDLGHSIAREIGGRFVHCDVSDPDDNRAMVGAALDAYGRLGIAVLNAGIGETTQFLDGFDPVAYRRMVAVNLDGVVYGMHAVLRALTAAGRRGSIIVTASLAGLAESPFTPLYSATKHAVVGLVRSIGPALAERGVTVNAICPTFVDTPMLADVVDTLRSAHLAVLDVDEVVDAVEVALASDLSGVAWPWCRATRRNPSASPMSRTSRHRDMAQTTEMERRWPQ